MFIFIFTFNIIVQLTLTLTLGLGFARITSICIRRVRDAKPSHTERRGGRYVCCALRAVWRQIWTAYYSGHGVFANCQDVQDYGNILARPCPPKLRALELYCTRSRYS